VSTTNNVQVTYRHVELAAAAPLSERGDGSFRLTLDAPPPVRTVLSIAHGGRTQVLEVVEVIETAGDGSARGCVLREVGHDRLPHVVGSEHLRDGALGAAEGDAPRAATAGEAAVDDGYGAHMAVPSPVVSDDASEANDVGDDANGNDANGNDANGNDANGNDETNGDGGTSGDSGSNRAKKRRGRQRK